MAFIPVPNTAVCHVVAELFGQIIENTLYFEFPEAPLASEIAQLAASVGQWAVGALCANLAPAYHYLRTEAQDLTTEGAPAYTDVVGTGTAGGDTGTVSAPGGTCLAISFRTALGGRSFRGRNYVSGLPLVNIDGNQLDADETNLLVGAYQSLMSYIVDDLPDVTHVVVSRYHLGAPRAAGITTPVLTYLATNRDLDSQRRRLSGRGT